MEDWLGFFLLGSQATIVRRESLNSPVKCGMRGMWSHGRRCRSLDGGQDEVGGEEVAAEPDGAVHRSEGVDS